MLTSMNRMTEFQIHNKCLTLHILSHYLWLHFIAMPNTFSKALRLLTPCHCQRPTFSFLTPSFSIMLRSDYIVMVPLLLESHNFENWGKIDDFTTKKEDNYGEMYKLQNEAILEHLRSATTTSGFVLIQRLEIDIENSTWEEGSGGAYPLGEGDGFHGGRAKSWGDILQVC